MIGSATDYERCALDELSAAHAEDDPVMAAYRTARGQVYATLSLAARIGEKK